MLQFIRGTVGSWVVKILFLLLIASFAVWGIGDIFRSDGAGATVAKVGGTKVTSMELDQEFRQQISRLRPLLGGQFDVEQAIAMGLADQSLQTIIRRILYDRAADDLGIRIGDDLVRQRIAQVAAFQGPNGRFDPEMFRRVLSANQLSEPAFVMLLRRDMTRELMVGAVTTGTVAPAPLVADLYRHRQEQRIAETITIPSAAFTTAVGQPDEPALAAFHQDHAVRYTAPEYRGLTIATLTVDDVAADISVAEEDVRAAYEARIADFRTPERRQVTQVVVDNQTTAQSIVAAAAETIGGLEQAARSVGKEAVALGAVSREDLPDELAGPVFAAASGHLVGPIESPLGWHIVGITGIEPGASQDFAGVRTNLLAELRRDKALDRLYGLSNQLDDTLASGAPLEEAVAKLGLKTTSLDAVDPSGHTPGDQAVVLPALGEVLKAAFNLDQGKESRLTETKDGVYFVVRVNSIVPPALRPLEAVRAQVVADWQAEERSRLAAVKAEELAQTLGNGANTADAVARAAGFTAEVQAPFTRTTARPALPADLVRQLFTLAPGGVAAAETSDGRVVARLKEIKPVDPATAGGALEPLRQEMARTLGTELVEQFGNALRQRYPVSIERATIDAMYKRR